MKRALLSLIALTLLAMTSHAQQVGDTEPAVVKALGNPPLNRTSGDRQIWIYSNGTKIVFQGGVVVEAKLGTVQPAAPVEDMMSAEPPPRVTAPKPPVARVSAAPTAAPAQRATFPSKFALKRSPLGLLLSVAGYGVMFVCGIMIIVAAFRESVAWGVAVLIFPFAQIAFVTSHWSETKKPFLLTWLVGLPLIVVSFVMDFKG